MRARWRFGWLLALVACGGSDVTRRAVEIDLLAAGVAIVDGKMGRLPLVEERGRETFVQGDARMVDLPVTFPARAELRLRLPAGTDAAAFAVSIVAGDAVQRLAPTRGSDGVWRARVPVAADSFGRVRLERLAAAPLVWRAVHVAGEGRFWAAPLAADARRTDRPNVVIYLVDALRADHLSLYGYGRPTSPNLEALARRGALFTSAYATGPSTPNSIPSLFTSRYPSELHINFRQAKAAEQTLAEAFGAAGYRTAAFTANPLLLAGFGFARGFGTYELMRAGPEAGTRWVRTDDIQAKALAWIGSGKERPFFLYVHTLDVHTPYDPPPPFRGRFEHDGKRPAPSAPPRTRLPGEDAGWAADFYAATPDGRAATHPDRYDEAIAYVDDAIGRFVAALEALGVADRTVIVVTADHGESLGPEDDGSHLHGHALYEEQVRVPLLFVLPWSRPARVETVTSLLDLAPTLADLAAIAPPRSWLGRSLVAPTERTGPPLAMLERLEPPFSKRPMIRPGLYTVAEWGLREGAWKLLIDPLRTRLFHLPSDAKETRDVSAAHPDVVWELTAAIWRRSPALADEEGAAAAPPAAAPAAPRPEMQEALEALGYVE